MTQPSIGVLHEKNKAGNNRRGKDHGLVSYQKPEAKHPVSLGGYKTTAERILLRKHFSAEIGAHLSKCVSNTVRPHLEFASLALSPWSPSDQDVRMVTGIKGARYKDKCKVLGLQTLKNRRLKQDLMLAHKFIISDIDKSSDIPQDGPARINYDQTGGQH
jgi:hypothetical protein